MFDQNEVAAGGPAGYWADVMGAFKSDAANALYQSCAAKDDMTAVIKISRPTSKFPTALSLDSFSMQSPKALKAGDANNVTKQGEGFGYPAYSKNPVGTGPYKLDKYDEANKTVTLVRNEDYWGEKAKTAKLVAVQGVAHLGVGTLSVAPFAGGLEDRLHVVRTMAELMGETGP
jgi:peptide/nickel transport system substrate-binding protein